MREGTVTVDVSVPNEPLALDQLETLFRAEYPQVVRLALLLTGNAAVAEELAQEAFLRVAPRAGGAANPGAYLRVTLVNLCRDYGRRQATVRRNPEGLPRGEGTVGSQAAVAV